MNPIMRPAAIKAALPLSFVIGPGIFGPIGMFSPPFPQQNLQPSLGIIQVGLYRY